MEIIIIVGNFNHNVVYRFFTDHKAIFLNFDAILKEVIKHGAAKKCQTVQKRKSFQKT